MPLAALLFSAYNSDDSSGGPRDTSRAGAAPGAVPPPTRILNDADADLIARVQGGDRAAFDALFLEYYSALCHFAARYADETQAAEIVSETFLRLWISRESWAPRTTVRAYLYGAVRRMAIDVYRSTHAEQRRYATPLGADETWGMAAPEPSPVVDAEMRAATELVWQAIATLSEVQRSVMALRWQAQLSWEEIAAALGLSNAAVRMQHSRALARLREILPAHLGGDE